MGYQVVCCKNVGFGLCGSDFAGMFIRVDRVGVCDDLVVESRKDCFNGDNLGDGLLGWRQMVMESARINFTGLRSIFQSYFGSGGNGLPVAL
jgi:hypothetical protein